MSATPDQQFPQVFAATPGFRPEDPRYGSLSEADWHAANAAATLAIALAHLSEPSIPSLSDRMRDSMSEDVVLSEGESKYFDAALFFVNSLREAVRLDAEPNSEGLHG